MTNLETILIALDIDLKEFRNGMAAYTDEVCVSLDDNDETRIIICDSEGWPVASVGEEDVEYILGRVTDADGLRWLHRWAPAGGHDVEVR